MIKGVNNLERLIKIEEKILKLEEKKRQLSKLILKGGKGEYYLKQFLSLDDRISELMELREEVENND